MKTHLRYYLLGLLLILPSFYWLFSTNYWNMHDDMQILRQLELEKCLEVGQFPCRWSPDPGYQFGYPLLNFYPPLPYLVGQLFRFAGFSFVMSIKMVAILQFVFSYSAMYALGLFLGGGLTGLLAGVFYTYLPYHAVNIYIRGAMNEAWAGVFFPLIVLFILRLAKKITLPNIIALSLSFCGLFLSHLPMSLIFSLSLFPLVIYQFLRLPSSRRLSLFLSLASSSVLAVALGAFFLIPVVTETRHVQIDSMFNNYYHFSVHFTTLKQLFITQFWGDGASVWGSDDGMSFSLGTIHWLLLVISLISAAYYQFIRKKSHPLFLYLAIFAFLFIFTAFMTHNRSTFLWQLFPFIQKIQFPWRFLSLSGFYLALSISLGQSFLPDLPSLSRRSLSWLICLVTIIFNLHFFRPLTSGPITDSQKLSGKAWENQITSGIYDYLPIWSSRAPNRPPKQPTFDQTDYPLNIQGFSSAPGQARLNFQNPQLQTGLLPTLYYPNLRLYLDTQSQNYFVDKLFGQPRLILPSGDHRLDYFYSDNLLRRLANLLSLFSLWLVINIRPLSQWMTPLFRRSRPRH